MAISQPDCNRPLPIILCLHGGGANSGIFTVQTAKLRRKLSHQFQFIFADGPVLSRPGPGVLPFFEGCGPYRRWVRESYRGTAEEKIKAFQRDERAAEQAVEKALEGVTDKVVGVMGFSVGGGMCTGLLQKRQRMLAGDDLPGDENTAKAWKDLQFGILLMGTPPSWFESEMLDDPDPIRLPTVHVHGLRDPWLVQSRILFHRCFERNVDKSPLLELDVGHEIQYTESDYEKIVSAIMDVARRGGPGNG
ncbi:hypothetical protein VTN77DRAFT_4668 [Rasamsonia byssochlamydoides]|uniref:uncharacterized protein n=1 Tax=Rasamsonia byssochlamydoides TaxID=89139 RepID=UPI0037445E77